MGLLISVGGLMYVNSIRSLSEIKQKHFTYYLNYLVGLGEEYSPKNLLKDSGEQFDELKKYNTWKESFKHFEGEIWKSMDALEGYWHSYFLLSTIGIGLGLYLIWVPLNIPVLNDLVLGLFIACMALQFVAFFDLTRRASIAMKL